jgi:hypothetical protein
MSVSINLYSKKTGEIKKFLERFYEKAVEIDKDIDQWIYVYNSALEAVDIISALMDNSDKFKITACVQIIEGNIHPVTHENHNDIIKGMFSLFYEEKLQATY